MFRWISLFLLIAEACVCFAGPSERWLPAVYRTLVVGKSSRAAVLKVLGPPKELGKDDELGTPYFGYVVSDPFPGTLDLYLQKGRLISIVFYPAAKLSLKSAASKFGRDFVTTRYSFDDCLGSGGAGPTYEDPEGTIEIAEYRKKGIALGLHDLDVEYIEYVAKPKGARRSQCGPHGKPSQKR